MEAEFRSHRNLLAQAGELVEEFEGRVRNFITHNPSSYVTELDPRTGETVHKVRLFGRVPDHIDQLSVQVLNALRSSLEQAVYAAGRINGVEDPNTEFPVVNSAAEFPKPHYKRIKDVSPRVMDELEELQPYHEGNWPLRRLHDLRNHNFHRRLVPMAVSPSQMNLNGFLVHGGNGIKMSFQYLEETNEVECFRTTGQYFGRPPRVGMNLAFSVEGPAGRMNAPAEFKEMHRFTKEAVDRIERASLS